MGASVGALVDVGCPVGLNDGVKVGSAVDPGLGLKMELKIVKQKERKRL